MKNWYILFVLVVVWSCTSNHGNDELKEETSTSTEEIKSQQNPRRFPNKRSELAILMRNLNDELAENKSKIEKGEMPQVDWVKKYSTISTATPTDSNDSGPVFHGFSQKFLSDLKAFQESDSSHRIETFNAMIQSCLDCHQEHCHGPMVAIRKLKI